MLDKFLDVIEKNYFAATLVVLSVLVVVLIAVFASLT